MDLASVNWTTIGAAAVTGLTAIAVALSGYFSSRLTARVTQRGVEEETRRAREQREEAHRVDRAAVYGRILSGERALRDWLMSGDTSDQGEALRKSLLTDLDTVILTAPHAVADAAVAFIEEVWTVHITREVSVSPAELEERDFGVIEVGPGDFGPGPQWAAKRSALVNAMRSDLAGDTAELRNLRRALGGERLPSRRK